MSPTRIAAAPLLTIEAKALDGKKCAVHGQVPYQTYTATALIKRIWWGVVQVSTLRDHDELALDVEPGAAESPGLERGNHVVEDTAGKVFIEPSVTLRNGHKSEKDRQAQ